MSDNQKRSARPLLAMILGILGVLVPVALMQRGHQQPQAPPASVSPASRQEQENAALIQQALDSFGSGNRQAAFKTLDSILRQPLDLHAGGAGTGDLQEKSSSTLYLRLGIALRDQAIRDSAISPSDARSDIEQCRRLSEHVLNSPQPALSSLILSHCLDELAASAQSRIAPGTVALASDRSFWQREVMGNIVQWTERWNARDGNPEERTASEQSLAEGLTSRYRAYRLGIGVASAGEQAGTTPPPSETRPATGQPSTITTNIAGITVVTRGGS